MNQALIELLSKIANRLSQGAYPNEAAVSFSIVIPLLRALGWDDSDPTQVMPEYASGGRRVDFALCSAPMKPAIFIEVKGVGRSLEGDRQLFEYAFHEGIPFCILTDGREWSFYLPSGQGTYDERRVYRLRLDDRMLEDAANRLIRYLHRERVRSRQAFHDAAQDHQMLAARRDALLAIPKAWNELVQNKEDFLIELVADQAETISGFRPSQDAVISFLKSLGDSPTTRNETLKTMSSTSPFKNVKPESRRETQSIVDSTQSLNHNRAAKTSNREIIYIIFGEERHSSNAKGAFIDILTEIGKRYYDRLEDASQAVAGRTRKHIARSENEVYPARPDLANAIEFAPGWLVGLNVANREKSRIIRGVCDAVGIQFGHDVVVQFPNE